MNDNLQIGTHTLTSRLFLGTGKFANNRQMPAAIVASQAQIITVALRRANLSNPEENILSYVPENCLLMPNTSGARTAEEAVRIARLARELGCGTLIKIEVISDNRYLLPNNLETIKATEILAKEGFTVMPYMNPDLMDAQRLVDAGAASVMPLAAPIGTNRGLRTKEMIRILIEEIDLPIVVDAGIGRPSEAAEAMEMGADAVLVNTAVATAKDPIAMAEAFKLAVQAGRQAYLAGLGPISSGEASASSPLTGFLFKEDSDK